MILEYRITDNSGIFKKAKDEAVQRAMESVGLFLETEAADELENDPRRVDTSRLKNSISHRAYKSSVVVGTNVEYAVYVHFGTRKMKPNPFLKNAFERNLDQIKDYVRNKLKGF